MTATRASSAAVIRCDALDLERELARGAVTQVWRVRSAAHGVCALKFPLAKWSDHPGAARLIEREWEMLRRLSHPHIVTAHGLVTMATGPGLLTAYLDGGDLVALTGASPRHWAAALRGIVAALAYLHERSLVHRDVKPRNIRFDSAGRARLIDFAAAARIGEVSAAGAGTPAYRRAGREARAPARQDDDLHALAVTVHELSCGRLPLAPVSAEARLGTPGAPPDTGGSALARLTAETHAVLAGVHGDDSSALAAFCRRLDAIIEVGR